MPYRLPGDDGARWRCLDVQAWALVALVCALYIPRVGRTYLGELSLLYMGPVVLGLLSALALGDPAGMAGPWQSWRLRGSWLTLAGLAPFVSWWLRCPDVPYLAVGSLAAMAAACWALLETTAMVSWLARARGIPRLVLHALVVRVGLLYLLVIPITSLWVTFAAALLVGWATVPGDWLRFWRLIPGWGRLLLSYAPMLAMLGLARLLWRAASCLSALPCSADASGGENAHELSGAAADTSDRRP